MTIRYECCDCNHPVEFHDPVGCTWPDHDHDHDDSCGCNVTARQLAEDTDQQSRTELR